MSWDIVLFNSDEKITSVRTLDESKLMPTDFCLVFEKYFPEIIKDNNHRKIKGKDFSVNYFLDKEPVSNKLLSLYGENGIYELIELSKKNNWQIFDMSLEQMIDLDNPSKNGYMKFKEYLKQILER